MLVTRNNLRTTVRSALARVRHRTIDREASPVLVAERIGPKRWKTPEGYLYCEGVPAARVGEMVYVAGEIPLEPGTDGLIHVVRDAKALFAPTTLASYNGKPAVNEHPAEENLDANNWRRMVRQVVGVVLNPRQGEGDENDVMLVDLLIMDKQAIADIEAGKVEVSAGYEADYEQTGLGAGRQLNIIGNHVALVERGRCGPRCAIGDHQPKEISTMPQAVPNKRRAVLSERIRVAFKDAEESFMAGLEEDPLPGDDDDATGGDGTHIHIHAGGPGAPAAPAETKDDPVEARFQSIESSIQQIMQKLGIGAPAAPGGDTAPPPAAAAPAPAAPGAIDTSGVNEDEVKMTDALPEELEVMKKEGATNDSAALATAFQAVLADAEILVPGFRLPTFDAKAKRRITIDSMCAVRRGVLRQLQATNDGTTLINSVAPSLDIEKSTCVDVALGFRAAAGARRLLNNAAMTKDMSGLIPPKGQPVGGVRTLAELNALHAKIHGVAGSTTH